jgi:GrpB-like predicted nucleotidyltransferase (UPF0157 family)
LRVDLDGALQALHLRHGALTVRVDAGPSLCNALLSCGLVDEVSLLEHPVEAGKSGGRALAGAPPGFVLNPTGEETLRGDVVRRRFALSRSRPVVVEEHDPAWAETFGELRDVLIEELGGLARDVEHVGSTAVPGLAAKPVIDLDVVLRSEDDLEATARRLAEIGYRHRGDLGVIGRAAFARDGADVPRDGSGRTWAEHHLYVCAQDSAELARHRAFRDHLRASPADASAYEALKRELADRCGTDRQAYADGKSEFIRTVLGRLGRPGGG